MAPNFLPEASPGEDRRAGPRIEAVRRSAVRWRWILGLAVAAMCALIWGVWAETTLHDRRQALEAAARRQGNLAVAVSHYLRRALANADGVAHYLSTVRSIPGADFHAQLRDRSAANALFTEMLFCGDDGSVLAGRQVSDGASWARPCAAWLREAPPEARTYPGRPVQSPGPLVVPLLTRVAATGDLPGGVLALLVDVRSLLGLMQDYNLPDETSVLIAGGDGQVRARWHSAVGMADQRSPELAVLPTVLATGTLGQPREVEGRQLLVSARHVPPYALTVLIATSIPDTLEAPNARSRRYAVGCVLATLLLSTFALLLLRLQTRSSRMAEALARAHSRLQAANEALEEKVRARTAELEAAYRELEGFSYSVAHDVRAPLTAIRGFADALAPSVAASGDPKAAHFLRRIAANATQMSELTEALLALGRLSGARLEVADIDLSAMAREVIDSLREREQASRAVRATVEDGLEVRGDRVLVRQVLENLLGNAWKFTSTRATALIRVESCGAHDGWLTVAVRDNGEGFVASQASDVFKPFRRMHAASAFPGTGIGLATVEKILRLHGGRAWIESSPEDGTSVYITLPRAGAVRPPA